MKTMRIDPVIVRASGKVSNQIINNENIKNLEHELFRNAMSNIAVT